MPDDSQTESEPAVHPGRFPVCLPETVEDVRQKVCRNALPVVLHGDLQLRSLSGGTHANATAFGRELDGVRQQVPEDLPQTMRVTHDQLAPRLKIGLNLYPFCFRGRHHSLDGRLDDFVQVNRATLNKELACDDA